MSPEAVRPLAAGELAQAAAIHALCFDEPWDAATLAQLLEAPGTFACAAGSPLSGFVLARIAAGEAEILTIAVVPAARRQRLGHLLMTSAAATALAGGATALFLEVAEDNRPALALYRRLGFRQVGTRPAYYARPQGRIAAHILRLDLAGGPLS